MGKYISYCVIGSFIKPKRFTKPVSDALLGKLIANFWGLSSLTAWLISPLPIPLFRNLGSTHRKLTLPAEWMLSPPTRNSHRDGSFTVIGTVLLTYLFFLLSPYLSLIFLQFSEEITDFSHLILSHGYLAHAYIPSVSNTPMGFFSEQDNYLCIQVLLPHLANPLPLSCPWNRHYFPVTEFFEEDYCPFFIFWKTAQNFFILQQFFLSLDLLYINLITTPFVFLYFTYPRFYKIVVYIPYYT